MAPSTTRRHIAGTRIIDAALRTDLEPVGKGGMGVVEDFPKALDVLRRKGVRVDLIRQCMIDGTSCHYVRDSRFRQEALCKVVKRANINKVSVLDHELLMTRVIVAALTASGYSAFELTALPTPPHYYQIQIPGKDAEVPLIPMQHMATSADNHLLSLSQMPDFPFALLRCVSTFLAFCDVIHAAGIAYVDAKLPNMLVRSARCSAIPPDFKSEFVVIDFGLSFPPEKKLTTTPGGTPGLLSPMLLYGDDYMSMSRNTWIKATGTSADFDVFADAARRFNAKPTSIIDFHSMGASIAETLLSTEANLSRDRYVFVQRVAQILLLGHEHAAGKFTRLKEAFPFAAETLGSFSDRVRLARDIRRDERLTQQAAREETRARTGHATGRQTGQTGQTVRVAEATRTQKQQHK